MATIAVGDIHGNLAALDDMLAQLRQVATDRDTIVFLGDYIDRGPDSRGCIDAVLRFQREVDAQVVCLLGNHEDWLLRTLHDYGRHSWLLSMEGLDTVRSYSADAERTLREAIAIAGAELFLGKVELPYDAFFDCVPQEHLRFFQSLNLYHQSADCICSHGGLDPRFASLGDQPRDALIWGAGTFPDGYDGADLVIYGHWNNAAVKANGWPIPFVQGRTIGVDSIAHGVLTAVRVPELRVFQSGRHDPHEI